MPSEVVEMLRQGRKADIWKQYCGFLDLSLKAYMKVQESLLLEQLHLAASSELARIIAGGPLPTTVEEFREKVPLTTYQDYEPYLTDEQEHLLPRKAYLWSHTSGRSGRFKMVPYSEETYRKAGEKNMAAVILSMARRYGDIRLEEGDVLLYNTPARPYSSGIALISLAELFPFHFVPPLEKTESLTFQERMELSFQMALVTGIDIIGSITSVLVKIGERFSQGGGGAKPSRYLLHPKAMFRLTRALIRSRMAGRPLLPKDLWTVKSAMCGGTDTSLYKKTIEEYWGVTPYELYAATELGGTAAVQAWNRRGLYFFPDVAFYEFIPEREWMKNREDSSYNPSTVLLDEVETGQRYELVMTSFDGGPFLRYRLSDLILFESLRDEKAGINLPGMICSGRADGLIDLAGFTGLMDEPMVWHAIHDSGIPYEDWTVRKEDDGEESFLHLYIELKEDVSPDEAERQLNESFKQHNQFYADLINMLEVRPLRLTILPRGTFRAYYLEKQAAGADLAHLKPPHMNPSDEIVNTLLRLGQISA
ncbi:MAG: GH3 auxin-responsive promoter family protein [Chloroflexi bacterium]|nr:GH3 auxin-responsive promoter family protein [Chloroflexota bacterium]